MKMWMFNCREVSYLVSQSMDHQLSLPQRIGVRFHLLMCRYCARFVRQLHRMREMIGSHRVDVPPQSMSLEAKEKLRKMVAGKK